MDPLRTGVAPNRGPETRLRDIVLAVQTEIPLVKQHLSDQLWAIRGEGIGARRFNRVSGASEDIVCRPSNADTVAHGFATVARFFPGARDILAAIDDEIMLEAGGPPVVGKAICFEDQYISTGGQLYELMVGHDRFIADLRPLLRDVLSQRGMPHPLCCHPYDLCTVLIAEELGLHVTDAAGYPLDTPLDLETDVAWVAYANATLRARVEPALRAALERHTACDRGSETSSLQARLYSSARAPGPSRRHGRHRRLQWLAGATASARPPHDRNASTHAGAVHRSGVGARGP